MKIYHQSVFDLWPLEDKSIQAIITSPPYYSLRKYDIPDIVIGGDTDHQHEWTEQSNNFAGATHRRLRKESGGGKINCKNGYCTCGAWKGQFGLESTYQEYIEHIRLWAKEAWRVLKDDGVMFINLGDSYNGPGKGPIRVSGFGSEGIPTNLKTDESGIQAKCKLLIPHRMAIALIDDGWILRNDIVWFKPNAMPESCKDRFSKKLEYIFMFTKKPKYYFDLDSIRDAHQPQSIARTLQNNGNPVNNSPKMHKGGEKVKQTLNPKQFLHSKGKNPGDLWVFNTQPSPEKHYAMWPEKLVERMILCSSRREDIVLDPFAGSGTTLRVADILNRSSLGIDLGYTEIQELRLSGIQKELL